MQSRGFASSDWFINYGRATGLLMGQNPDRAESPNNDDDDHNTGTLSGYISAHYSLVATRVALAVVAYCKMFA